jgi:hypothetical protein
MKSVNLSSYHGAFSPFIGLLVDLKSYTPAQYITMACYRRIKWDLTMKTKKKLLSRDVL